MTRIRTRSKLTHLALGVATALSLLGTAPAMASVVNFENASSPYYVDGDVLSEAGFAMKTIDTHEGGGGLTGAIFNGMIPNNCDQGGCPINNSSFFYAGLADSALQITRDGGGAFSLTGLDYSFLAPVSVDNYSYGQLVLTGTLADGSTIGYALDFPGTNANGNPLFETTALVSGFTDAALTSLTIRACLFDGAGACIYPHTLDDFGYNQAAFAIDNLVLADVAAVPEPGSLALIGLGLGALTLRRRKAAASHAANAAINA